MEKFLKKKIIKFSKILLLEEKKIIKKCIPV